MTTNPANRRARTRTSLVVGVLLATFLAGCSSSDGSTSAEGGPQASMASRADGGADQPQPASGAYDAETGTEALSPTTAPKEIIYEGWADLVADDPIAAADATAALVAKRGGHVQAREQRAPREGVSGWANLTVRIPTTALEDTLAAVGDVAEVTDIRQNQTDVTAEGADLDARIAALQTSIDRLLELMVAAERTEDLLTIERELADRQANLDGITAQRAALSGRVSLATFELSFTTPEEAPRVGGGTFVSGLQDGWDALLTTLSGALVVLGALLPWAAFAGVILTIVLVVVRARRRTRPKPPTEGAPTV